MASLGKNAEIQEWIRDLRTKNQKLERIQVKMGSSYDTPETRTRLTKDREETTKLIKKIIGALRENRNKELAKKLTKELETELNKFEDVCKKIEIREREIMTAMGSEGTDEEEQLSPEEKKQKLQEKNIDAQFLEYNEQDIARRHQEILAIERDAVEILEMFKDMRALVMEQKEGLDVIEGNINDAKLQADQGEKELVEAEKLQQKARKKQCCILFITIAILGVLVLAVLFGTGAFKK